ncbi:MAG: PQQ-dependent sugar dehydrogenase [Anaerolineae bacterium]|nr:PQQ-dependent sugar dehydrogenase [Anaerolineae bacterium]
MRYLPRFLLIAVASLLVTFSFTTSNSLAAAGGLTLPAGFVDEVAYDGLLAPRAFTFTPDGRVLVVERGSAASDNPNLASIRVFKNGTLLPTRAYTLNTCGDSERGLLGITVDPDFLNNGYIYIYYTRQATAGSVSDACAKGTFASGNTGGPRNRISRLTMSGDEVVPGSERVLIDSIITEQGNHNAGDLHFGPDGYLYASTGDGAVTWTSPDTGTLNGKIIRILPTAGDAGGYTTTGNPYDGDPLSRTCSLPSDIHAQGHSTGPCKEIYAKGFRNPFRFTMQPDMAGIPGTGSPFIGDAGQNTWEEVDQVQTAGGDYGWPVREGFCANGIMCTPPYQSGGYDNPIYAYSHKVGSSSVSSVIIGGDFYTGGANYPPQYMNNYFFAEFERGFISRLVYNAGQWVVQDFATGGSGIIGLKRGLDGNLYYLTFTSPTARINTIRRIRYVAPANAAPARNYFTTDTPTLTWNRVTFAHHYVLQVSKTSDFMGAPTYQAGNNLSYMLPSLSDGFYYWRVAACSSTVTCGNWSATDTFVVDVP